MIGLRKPHMLKRNEGNETPQNLLLFDTETYGEAKGNAIHHSLRLGWAVHWRRLGPKHKDLQEWFFFRRKDEFWDWFKGKIRNETKLYVSAHNLDFDWAVVDGYTIIPSWGYELKKGWERQNAFFRLYTRKGSSICLIDSINLWPMTLEALGKSLGIEKLKVDFKRASDEELSEYCRRDVEILLRGWEWWLRTIEEDDLGNFKPTLAGQAFSAYRHRFMENPIYIHNNESAIKLERNAYHGGRVECFFIGKIEGKKLYVLDVNSMYPAVMKENVYPRVLARYMKYCNHAYIGELIRNYDMIAEVLVETDEPVYCVVRDERLIFPVGRFWAYLSTPEIKYALAHGHIKECKSAAIYHRGTKFDKYVDYMYEERMKARREGRPDRELVFKLLLNSLYGKFGQKLDIWAPVGRCSPEMSGVIAAVDESSGAIRRYRMHEGIIEVYQGEIEGYESFVAIPAHCTAYARMKLWEYMKKAGLEHTYYVDTDSLWVDEVGYERLREEIDPNRLGALKLETIVERAIIRGPKDYICGDKEKIKGVRKNAVQKSENEYEQEQWLGYKMRLRKGLINTPTVERITKSLQRKYDKGYIQSDGRVLPITLEE